MGSVIDIVRCVTWVAALWSIASLIVAVPISALFRVQARADRIRDERERRRIWRDALR